MSQKHIPRLYLTNTNKETLTFSFKIGENILIDGDKAHHLLSVLRMRSSDVIHIFNGCDGEWQAVITKIEKRQLTLCIQHKLRNQATLKPTLSVIFSPLRPHLNAFIIEKLTELGIHEFLPTYFERTQGKRHAPKQSNHLNRRQRIAIQASEQCGRMEIPTIKNEEDLNTRIKHLNPDASIIICDEQEHQAMLPHYYDAVEKAQSVVLVIGPEGGLTDSERKRLSTVTKCYSISLGPLTLRAETALITAVAQLTPIIQMMKAKTED